MYGEAKATKRAQILKRRTIMYESDITKFIKELKAAKPHLEEEQRKGRAIWWDKQPLDVDERNASDAAKVPQKPYPYATK
jgi:hypothetical protein